MSGVVGLGTVTYTPTGGSAISFKFHSPAGMKILQRSVTVVDSTSDTDTVKTFLLGNLPDNGGFDGTFEMLATAISEIKTMCPSSGALVWTGPLEVGTNTTECIISGTAGLHSIDVDSEENGLLKGPAKFKWLGDVTVSNETA